MNKECLRKQAKNHGITMIALVITIIVLLILAGVSIATLSGDNGLLSQSENAKKQTEISAEKEELSKSIIHSLDREGEIDWTLLDENKPKGFEGSEGVYTSKKGNTYIVDKEGNIRFRVELPTGIKAGDYVNYIPDSGIYKVSDGTYGTGATTEAGYQTFTTEVDDEETTDVDESLKWRVLSIDRQRGEIQLVSETVAQEQGLSLQGADGYNHGVDILNDMCSALYSKTVNGRKVAEARSINADDINAKTSYDYANKNSNYGVEYKYSNHANTRRLYPNLYEQEEGFYLNGVKQTVNRLGQSDCVKDGKIDKETGITEYKKYTGYTNAYTANKDISVTKTSYAYEIKKYLRTDLGENNAPNRLLNIYVGEWVATRVVSSDDDYSHYFLRINNSQGMLTNSNTLISCYHTPSAVTYAVRPVVTLKYDYNLALTEETDTANNNYWNLEFNV